MAVILGLNYFHADSAACLLVDGQLVGAICEERLGGRLKHDSSFPANAIGFLLETNGIDISDVDYVAVPRDPKANLSKKVEHCLLNPIDGGKAFATFLRRLVKSDLSSNFADRFEWSASSKKIKFKVYNVEHHLCHASSSYYCSDFESSAGFTYDASGDFVSGMMTRCEGNQIKIEKKFFLPDSLGFFYTAMCQFIGFNNFGEEFKVMGLAPYGTDALLKPVDSLITSKTDGSYALAKGFFSMHRGGQSGNFDPASGQLELTQLYTDSLISLLGAPRKRGDPLDSRHKDIAFATQNTFQRSAINSIRSLAKIVRSKNLILAGGCALNGVVNEKIFHETPFSNQFIHPAASDDGTSVGAALWVEHNVLKSNDRAGRKSPYLGPEYSNSQILASVKKIGLEYQIYKGHEVISLVAKCLAMGWVVGWFQGRAEWGPRALGNRSILADPSNPEMKNILNKKIKRRENFRPFAPSVLDSHVHQYFDEVRESPYMQHVTRFKPECVDLFPAVAHVDGTGRVQTVSKEFNPRYYALISEFLKLTGVGMLLNTSFNENEPIVTSPDEAIACYMRTDMDLLCMGDVILTKKDICNQ